MSLLGLFNLSNACSFVFADRFVRLFWQHRTQDRGIEIGFEEFVRLLSIWTRGEVRGSSCGLPKSTGQKNRYLAALLKRLAPKITRGKKSGNRAALLLVRSVPPTAS